MDHGQTAYYLTDKKQLGAGIVLALIASLAYGSEAIIAKLLYAQGLTPLTILCWRFILATLVFLGWARPYFQPHYLQRNQLYVLFLLGLSQGITVVFLFYAFMYIPVGLAIFLFYLYPTLVIVLEALLLNIKPDKKRIGALILTLLGLIVIAGRTVAGISWPGFFCAVAAAVGNAIFLILSKQSLDGLPLPLVTAGTTVSATAFLLLVGSFTRTPLSFPITPLNLGLLLFLVLIPSVLALSCLFAAVARLGPSRTAIVGTTEPFITSLLGLFILTEQLLLRELIGGILIVLAVVLESVNGSS
ncbi:MAG TPA: EamA family transporter [bacterium]|nr:EamA family transporter [bacterium]